MNFILLAFSSNQIMAFQVSLATSSSLKFNTTAPLYLLLVTYPLNLFLLSTDFKHLLEKFVDNIMVYNLKVHHDNKLPQILVSYFETLKNCAGLGFLVLEWQYSVYCTIMMNY